MKVRIRYIPGRKRWEISYQIPSAAKPGTYERTRNYFLDEATAKREAAAILARHKNHGREGARVDLRRWHAFLRAEERLEGASLEDAIDFFLRHRPAANTPSLEDAIWAFMDHRRDSGVSRAWEYMLDRYLKRLHAQFSEVWPKLDPGALLAFIKAQGGAKDTQANAKRVLGAFFRFCMESPRRWISDNPLDGMPDIRITRPEPELIRPEAMRDVMDWLWRHEAELIPFAALKFFTGMRSSAIYRARWEDIRMGQGILLPAKNAKNKRRTFIQGLPDCLWSWLAPFARPAGRIAAEHYQPRLTAAFKRCGHFFPKNGGRHSFASYHIAARQDGGLTALILAHRGPPRVLWDSYVGNATQADGVAWFSSLPPPLPELGRSIHQMKTRGEALYADLPRMITISSQGNAPGQQPKEASA